MATVEEKWTEWAAEVTAGLSDELVGLFGGDNKRLTIANLQKLILTAGILQGTLDCNSQFVLNPQNPTLDGHVGNRAYNDLRYELKASGALVVTEASAPVLTANRTGSDGEIFKIQKDGTDVLKVISVFGVLSAIILDPRTNGAGLGGTTNVLYPVDENAGTSNGVISLGQIGNTFKDLHLAGNVLATEFKSFYVPLNAMTPATTNGPDTATIEGGTNAMVFDVLDFDGATDESAWFHQSMPDDWDGGNIKFKVAWTSTVGTGTFICKLFARSIDNGQSLDNSVGSGVTVTDTMTSADDLMLSDASAGFTPVGSPTLGDTLMLKFERDATTDTIAVDVRVIGIHIQYKTLATAIAEW